MKTGLFLNAPFERKARFSLVKKFFGALPHPPFRKLFVKSFLKTFKNFGRRGGFSLDFLSKRVVSTRSIQQKNFRTKCSEVFLLY
jgi:hypothetical protein